MIVRYSMWFDDCKRKPWTYTLDDENDSPVTESEQFLSEEDCIKSAEKALSDDIR